MLLFYCRAVKLYSSSYKIISCSRKLLIGGAKGHVATFDWQTGQLGCEFHAKETIRDIAWLHNRDYIAVAQKKVSSFLLYLIFFFMSLASYSK